ncbi:MAG: hypothetical protein P4L83_07815 [Nevskia sp.]|nr:hypothetical protein [Nevskia sp.]
MNTHRPALHVAEKTVLVTLFLVDAIFVGFMLFFVGVYMARTDVVRLPVVTAAGGAPAVFHDLRCPAQELRSRDLGRSRCR